MDVKPGFSIGKIERSNRVDSRIESPRTLHCNKKGRASPDARPKSIHLLRVTTAQYVAMTEKSVLACSPYTRT
jgi:hypothetical protein